MTILEYVEQQINDEEKRLTNKGLPLEEREITYNEYENGFIETIVGKRSQYGKLLDIRYDILNNDLYGHDKFNHYSFKTFNTEQAFQKNMLNKGKAFADNPLGTFIVAGGTGTGKSHICTSIVKMLMMKAYRSKYIIWQDELDRIKSLPYEERNKEIEQLGNVEVLYMDDFLKTSSNDGEITESDLKNTNNIINRRYAQNSITIISTELKYNEIEKIHSSMAGRLLEMSDTKNGNYFIMIADKKGRNYRTRFLPNEL